MSFYDALLERTTHERDYLLSAPIIQGAMSGKVSLDSYIAFLTEAYHHVKHTVPLLQPKQLFQELQKPVNKPLLLDTRSPAEYKVSHIAGARFVGFGDFNVAELKDVPKDTPLVVYCCCEGRCVSARRPKSKRAGSSKSTSPSSNTSPAASPTTS